MPGSRIQAKQPLAVAMNLAWPGLPRQGTGLLSYTVQAILVAMLGGDVLASTPTGAWAGQLVAGMSRR
jgi:hypothetical protein